MPKLNSLTFRQWRILSLDPEVALDIRGEFQPDDGVESDKQPIVVTGTNAGASDPYVQWVAGGADQKRFASRINSRHQFDDIRLQIADLKSLRQRNRILGRAPRIAFSWGDEEIRGFVTRLRTRTVGLWRGTGLPRAEVFDIEITKAEPVTNQPQVGEGETQFIRFRRGEIFETLGLRYLGDPLRGDLIRRGNPKVAQEGESPGRRVKVLEANHPDYQGTVVPTSIPFQDRDRRRQVWHPVVEALGAFRGSSDSPGRPWDLLPEVIAGDIDTDIGEP